MVKLPDAFIEQTRLMMGEERFARYLAAFDEEPPVSIRVNPMRVRSEELGVPWCPLGIYLSSRPNFTFDPLLHAGCYYVQEAASMFIHHILTQQDILSPLTPNSSLLTLLDLCAAPGGKSTCAISALPEGSEPLVQDDRLPGFIIAGPDGKWHVATARTTGRDEVTVSCPEVTYPVAVRYGWADNPTCTLRTKSDLHVAPFRTDRW